MNGRVLVTGASGFIGRALVAKLVREGWPAIAAARREFAAPPGAAVLVADADGEAQEALASCDCVVHLAGRAHVGGSLADFEPDVALAAQWARMSAHAGVRRFVHVSSIGVLGTRTDGLALTEQSTPAPREPYAVAKLAAEEAVRRELAGSDTDWVIVRPPMVYGPNAPGNFARLVRAVARGWPLPLASVRNRRHLVALENLVDALLRAIDAQAAAGNVLLISDADAVSTPELVTLVAQGLRVPARLVKCPPALLDFAARAMGRARMADSLLHDLLIDSSRSRQLLGWTPAVGVREAIVAAAAGSCP